MHDGIPLKQPFQSMSQAAEKINKKLGANHPDTLNVRANLALAYRNNRQLDKALPLMKQVLESRKAKLGEDHPKTLRSMYLLAIAYEDVGQREKGLSLLRSACELSKIRFGCRSPEYAGSHAHTCQRL